MTKFNVHFEHRDQPADAIKIVREVSAETPDDAAKIVRKEYPGCIIIKVKVSRSR